MEAFSALLALGVGNSPVTGEFPSQRPVMRSFDVFFDLRLNKRLSKNRGAGDLKRSRAHYDAILMGRYRLVGNTLTYRKRYVRLPENWCWMMDFASFAKCMIGLLLEICYCLFWYLRHRWTDASVFDIWRKLHFTPRIVNAANLTTLPEMLLGGGGLLKLRSLIYPKAFSES